MNKSLLPAILLLTIVAALSSGAARAQAQTPAVTTAPLVALDARDASAGTGAWTNAGTLGGAFAALGHPTVETVAGQKGVRFDGRGDAGRGPLAPAALTGNAPRTIEVWAYNPAVDSDEEAMVSWGKRGGPEGTLLAFGWGANGGYGAVSHWASDLGWGDPPTPARWHLLTYTFDGRTVRLYDDGVLKGKRDGMRLATAPGLPILLAAENGADGQPQFLNEYTHDALAGSLSLARVQIWSGARSEADIRRDFDADAARFGASRRDVEGMVVDGIDTFKVGTGATQLTLLRATQTAVTLSPDGGKFDFLPGDRIATLAHKGHYFLGDITLRARASLGDTATAGQDVSYHAFTSAARVAPIKPLPLGKGDLAACDLTPNLGPGCPLTVERRWRVEDGKLALRFVLRNKGDRPVELGAFGAAMAFNNLITGRSLDETHDKCSFATPSIGADAGYLQVTRLNGQGPALLVLPESGTSFEAYRPLYDDPTPRGVTFEGFYEWMTRSAAYMDKEWKDAAASWNPPSSGTIPPGKSVAYGYRFAFAPTIRAIEPTLIAEKRPVAVGIPGYVLATDTPGKLFLRYDKPVQSLAVAPAGALTWNRDPKPAPNGATAYSLRGVTPGRCRLEITYADGTVQAIPYFVTLPEAEQVAHLGTFHATRQWFADPADPFHRTDSWLAFDRRTDSLVTQHSHTWFAGLSDEIGAGPSVAMATKNAGMPDAAQVAQLEAYVDHALYGNLQNRDFSVRASLFYYEPKALPDFPYTVRDGWDKARGETTWRSFNYPHVTAVYWSLYHLARDHQGLTTQHPWDYYLDHAYQTAMAVEKFAPGYAEVGLMVGSVFPEVIRDLRREGWTEKADALEAFNHAREKHWETLRYPFGSEMPWDSTGQEEIYTWCRYFGADDKAQVTIDAITGYMPTVPNWAYNGAARRYFDAPVNGNAWPEIVQVTNHYGSGINSIPILDDFRRNPADLYLLRVGYAGMDQVLCNIDPRGFASYGFDTDPTHLDFDPYTADYGIAFYGYTRGAGAYVIDDPSYGLLSFGGVLTQGKDGFTVEPRDAFRHRVYLAPLGLWIILDAGTIERATCNPHTRQITLTLAPATGDTPTALLRLERPGRPVVGFAPKENFSVVRGAWAIPLGAKSVTVTIAGQ